jgi:ATP-binding cassette subfamily F protein 3
MAQTFIQIAELHKQYGATVIFDDAQVAIQDDHKIGVIGRNGAGKSTLCRLILGEEEADAGRIVTHSGLRLSYLEQKDSFLPGETVLAFLMRYSQQEDWRCGKLAGRFLLKNDLLGLPVAALSGGFQTRVKLCAMLLREPNFLILDEPTNYLDLKTLLLLEEFLCDYQGGFMIVSHDREFLKKTCTSTIEVERGQIILYPGDVEAYLGYKEQQREQAAAINANLEIRRKQLQTFVDKNKAKASKATQAASKVKMLERLRPIEIEHSLATVRITMPMVETRKGVVLRLSNLAIGYPGKNVAKGIELEIERGAHVAVLGDNGQGKTTFLSTLAGVLKAQAGELRWGHEVRIGTYAQHVFTAMDPAVTVRTYLDRAACSSPGPTIPSQAILDMAGCFLFRGDDVDKRIAVLSGGERSRLCLAGLLLAKYPVLLLDEPTNHLDFETVEALAAALRDYNGTVFFTSHDRTFVSLVATQIVEVRDGAVTLYPDDYGAYVYRIEKEVRDEGAALRRAGAASTGTSGPGAATARRERHEQLNAARGRLRTVEKQIAALDTHKAELTRQLADEPQSYQQELGTQLAQLADGVERLEREWLTLSEQIEALTSVQGQKAGTP